MAKKPSPAQLAARAKFIAMVKSKSKKKTTVATPKAKKTTKKKGK